MKGSNGSHWERIKRTLGIGGEGEPEAASSADSTTRRGNAHRRIQADRRVDASDDAPLDALPDHAAQYPNFDVGGGAESVLITIGFDWGTSCTKVVIGEPYGPSSPRYVVDFGGLGHAESPFLLPSKLFLDTEGHASLSPTTGSVEVPRVKLLLIEGVGRPVGDEAPNGTDPLSHEVAALYLAAALRHVRLWFLREHAESYRQYAIDWELNLGIPAANYDDEAACRLFREVARVGWWLSRREGPLRLHTARKGFGLAKVRGLDPGLADHAVNVIPEVAAQVVGYARSSSRQSGLHVIVDVGAATLDVAGFLLHEREGSDCYSILDAVVVPRGAFRLHESRVEVVTGTVDAWGSSDPTTSAEWCSKLREGCTPMVEVPPSMRSYYPHAFRAMVKVPDDPDRSYQKECWCTVNKVIATLRRRRDPNSPAWTQGLTVFVCGGGHAVTPFNKGLVEVNGWWQQNTPVAAFKFTALPMPSNIQSRDRLGVDFHRISVAYGLSHPAYDIGDVRPPSEIDDVPIPPTVARGFRYEDTKDWT